MRLGVNGIRKGQTLFPFFAPLSLVILLPFSPAQDMIEVSPQKFHRKKIHTSGINILDSYFKSSLFSFRLIYLFKLRYPDAEDRTMMANQVEPLREILREQSWPSVQFLRHVCIDACKYTLTWPPHHLLFTLLSQGCRKLLESGLTNHLLEYKCIRLHFSRVNQNEQLITIWSGECKTAHEDNLASCS